MQLFDNAIAFQKRSIAAPYKGTVTLVSIPETLNVPLGFASRSIAYVEGKKLTLPLGASLKVFYTSQEC